MANANETTMELVNELNEYTGDNFWQDVVESYDYDRDATDEADQSGRSDVVIMENGDEIRYREDRQKWVVVE